MAPKPRASTPGSASKRHAPDPNSLFSQEEPAASTKQDARAKSGKSSEPLSAPSAAESTQHYKADLPFDAKLVVEKGLHAGKILKLGAGTIVIGRSSKCDLSLKGSPGVSRRHTKIQLVDGRYVALDLESRNGTIVNGKAGARHLLHDGDIIEVCDEHIRFVAPAAKPAHKGAVPPPGLEEIEDRPTQLVPPGGSASPARPPPLPRKPPAEPFVDKTAGLPGLQGFDAPSALSARRAPPETRSHFIDVPRDVDDGTRTAPLAQPSSSDLDGPGTAALPDDDSEDSPPPPPRPRNPELSSPYVHGGSEQSGGLSAMHVLAALAVLVVLVLGAAAADTFIGPRYLLRFLNGGALPDDAVADAPAAPPAAPPAPATGGAAPSTAPQVAADAQAEAAPLAEAARAAEEAQAATAKAEEEAKAAETAAAAAKAADEAKAAEEAQAATAKAEEEAKAAAARAAEETRAEAARRAAEASAAEAAKAAEAKAASAGGEMLEVKATAAGKVARVAVSAGEKVRASGAIAWLEGGGNAKKLAALREEERDFAAAAKKGNKQAERDLEAVRASIAELERAGRGRALAAGRAGEVLEVLVQPGDKVEVGQVIARLRAAP